MVVKVAAVITQSVVMTHLYRSIEMSFSLVDLFDGLYREESYNGNEYWNCTQLHLDQSSMSSEIEKIIFPFWDPIRH